MNKKTFTIKLNASDVHGGLTRSIITNRYSDHWFCTDGCFQSGKIYGLVGEYGQGCMCLSYLMGGKVDLDGLRVLCDDVELTQADLQEMSWNLEPSYEFYRKAIVRKSIEKALKMNPSNETFESIAEKFYLTEPRYNRPLKALSGERWRASAALGYALGKKIFYAPYEPSVFYHHMCEGVLLNVLRQLADNGAIVLLPVGSDSFIKSIADECVYIDYLKTREAKLKELMREMENRD